MLTTRGWWLLIIALAVTTLGVLDGSQSLALLGLTFLCWILGSWFFFKWRLSTALPALRVQRWVTDERGPVDALWVGRSYQVHVELNLTRGVGVAYALVADYLPYAGLFAGGRTEAEGELTPGRPFLLRYGLRCPAPGQVRFEGVGLQFADLQGLFYDATLVPAPAVYRVLPPLADARGHRPTVKRLNLLPAPGVHRFLRPGTGSELLDLRDYLPGDPPKTIAWKISARRDRLITKEFESEVPLRCTLFVDTSQSVRLGPPGHNALARLVAECRDYGVSWAAIGWSIGTSGEAARQRFGGSDE